jgi:hypothetical protein
MKNEVLGTEIVSTLTLGLALEKSRNAMSTDAPITRPISIPNVKQAKNATKKASKSFSEYNHTHKN